MNSWKTEREIPYDIPYVWNLKGNNPKNFFTKQKETCRLRKGTYGCLRRGRDSSGVWQGHVHTAIFNMDNKDQLYSNVMGQPGWDAGLGENGYMYMYG